VQKNQEGMLFVVPASMPEKQFSKQGFPANLFWNSSGVATRFCNF